MAASEGIAGAVKEDLSLCQATSSTVARLQSLFGTVSKPKTVTTETRARIARTAITKSTRANSTTRGTKALEKGQKKVAFTQAQDDEARPLSPKARYTLATDIVNITLKVLQNAARSEPNHVVKDQERRNHGTYSSARSPVRTAPPALQERSSNASPAKSLLSDRAKGQGGPKSVCKSEARVDQICDWVATAECARLAFSQLRCADQEKLGVRALPKFQLETGMLALVSRLIALGLDDLAARELCAVKKRLECFSGQSSTWEPVSVTVHAELSAKVETLSSLIYLDVDLQAHPELASLSVAYWSYALSLLATSRRFTVIEQSLPYLELEGKQSAVAQILRHCEMLKDTAKATKQLDALSQALLRLCPSASASADEIAKDRARSVSADSAFNIQMIALSVRIKTIQLRAQPLDLVKDILEPISRAMSALLRRLPPGDVKNIVLETCQSASTSLQLSRDAWRDRSQAGFSISRAMSVLAERVGDIKQAYFYSYLATEQCDGLDVSHARHLAATIRKLACSLTIQDQSHDSRSVIDVITQTLQQSLSGAASDYEILLAELGHLLQNLDSGRAQCQSYENLTHAAGAFASRYSRLNPGKQTQTILDIVASGIANSRSNEKLFTWVSQDTAQALAQTDILQNISRKAASVPLAQSWSCCRFAVIFGRVLKALISKAVAALPEKSTRGVYDDSDLESELRGTVLEWQFRNACEIALKPSNKSSLANVLELLSRNLMEVYSAREFPVRRARVIAMLMRYRAAYPGVLPCDLITELAAAPNVEVKDSGRDSGLLRYLASFRASISISRSLVLGSVERQALEEQISIWSSTLDANCDKTSLGNVVDDVEDLAQQISGLCDFYGMRGDHMMQTKLLHLLRRLQGILGDNERLCSTNLCLTRSLLLQGYAELASKFLEEAEKLLSTIESASLAALDYQITAAQYYICVDKLDESAQALQSAAVLRSRMTPESIRSHHRKSFRLHNVRGWLTQSQHLLASGEVHQALQAAKRSVQVANSIWAGLQRITVTGRKISFEDQAENEARSINTLTRGISKLKLQTSDEKSSASAAPSPTSGVAFWSLLPLMCQALTHLCDAYVHHGLFNEASYASQQALKVAEGSQAWGIVLDLCCHRSLLLTGAGKIEEAELILARCEESETSTAPLTKVKLLSVKAAISRKNGDLESALEISRQAEVVLKDLQQGQWMTGLQRIFAPSQPGDNDSSARGVLKGTRKPTAKTRATARTATTKTSRTTGANGRKASTSTHPKEVSAWGCCYAIQKLEAGVMLQSTIIAAKIGSDNAHSIKWLAEFCQIFPDTLSRRMLGYLAAMQKAEAALEADFTFNALGESTLALPALQTSQRSLSVIDSTPDSGTAKIAKGSRAAKSKRTTEESVLQLLLAARHSLEGTGQPPQTLTTSETHKLHALLTETSMLLSASAGGRASEVLHPVREALHVDLPRIHAAECLSFAAKLECTITQNADLLVWPQLDCVQRQAELSAQRFQEDYVDILPKPWTAVSLSLNEQCDELYIVKYQHGQSPFLMRMPFSRQQSDDEKDELFDFFVGRSELQEIIELSNYSCHNPMDTSVKGAKTNWWSEREALDRRLQELLINMENIWLGGFRGLFAQHQRDDGLLQHFRLTFESILDRHLPSRSMKGGKRISLDDHILELFIGLGAGRQEELDIDEPLADLLYFVVDMLQFNGERNAYDEVDFDNMTVEISDALRTYYESVEQETEPGHLVLVLDKRLQAFPWESMPCLENTSVSRVDSMLTLRERIVAMRAKAQVFQQENRYSVSRHSGTYILNPSGDLKSTQAILAPELSKLSQANGKSWNSIIDREPSEEVFKAALQTSANLLYFGHGAGSQYIRPRAIKKMDACSEVVWLMGCSSGALTEYDELEPYSVPLSYLQAGQACSEHPSKCMAVLATLWDVTDKDIDRFSLAVGQEWGLWQGASEAIKPPVKTPRKRTLAIASTPEKRAKTPKTPKAHKTPVSARTPARSRSRAQTAVHRPQSLSEAVARSRDACFLRYLNGAAPVVYGVPIYLGD